MRPDLLAESRKREETAQWAYDSEMILRTPHSLPAGGYRLVYADSLPDPYGPDLTVFGPYRKALADDADYGVGR